MRAKTGVYIENSRGLNLRNWRLQCKINGQTVDAHNNEIEDQSVEYNNRQMSDVTINVEGVSVRFNGEKAWIKISGQYKNGQCGLCGHYDDEQDDEWRMNNNELTRDLALFHRSYSLQQDDECSADEQQTFYQSNTGKFRRSGRRSSESSSYSSSSNKSDEEGKRRRHRQSSESDESGNSSESREWEDQSFEGSSRRWNVRNNDRRHPSDYLRYSQSSEEDRRDQRRFSDSKRSNSRQQKPQEQTVVMEMGSSKICFSMEPVKQCPKGTFAMDGDDEGYYSSSEREGKQKQQQKGAKKQQQQGHEQGEKTKKVKFACLPRASSEARELLRQARQGYVLRMDKHQHSITEEVSQPRMCTRYY